MLNEVAEAQALAIDQADSMDYDAAAQTLYVNSANLSEFAAQNSLPDTRAASSGNEGTGRRDRGPPDT